MANQAATNEERLEQKVTIEDAGPAKKRLKIEVPADRLSKRLTEGFSELRDQASIPGFRRGRVPMRLLHKRFGSDVRADATSQIVSESYTQVIEENKLRVLGEPIFPDPEKLKFPEDGQALSFEVEIEVVPEFQLPDLTTLELKKPVITLDDERVQKEVDRYRELYGTVKPVDEKAKDGDYLTADVKITGEDGESLIEQLDSTVAVPGESRSYRGAVAGILVDDLGRKLAGKAINDEIELTATGPKNHENEKIRDKNLKIHVKVKRVNRMNPIAVEDLITQAGLATLDELKTQTKGNLEARLTAEQQQAMYGQIQKWLLENVEMEMPERASAQQAGQILHRRAIDLLYRGATQQDIEDQLAELRSASEEEAQRELKLIFILDAVAQQKSVQITEGEVNYRIFQMSRQAGKRPEALRQELARSGRLDQIVTQIRDQKAMDAIIGAAKVAEVSEKDWEAHVEAQKAKAEGKPEKKAKAEKPAKSEKKSEEKAEEKAADKPKGKSKKKDA